MGTVAEQAIAMRSNNIGPSWEDFKPFVQQAIRDAVQKAFELAQETGMDQEQLIDYLTNIAAGGDLIQRRLAKGGAEYGEDVLFLLGEGGAVSMAVTKAMRILWSFRKDLPAGTRTDSWLDIAGYAILEMARFRYEQSRIYGTEGEE